MSKRGQYKKTEPIEFLDDEHQPWDRQPAEGDQAWKAFVLYRDALIEGGIGKRSQREVCMHLFPNRDPTRARTTDIGRWSIKWRWRERVQAYDAHLDAVKLEAFRASLKRDAEISIAAYRAMRTKGANALRLTPAEAIHVKDAVRMVDVAITGLRREAGLATEIQGTEKDDAFATWLAGSGEPEEETDDGDAAAERGRIVGPGGAAQGDVGD